MNVKRMKSGLIALLLLFLAAPLAARQAGTEYEGAEALGLSLRRLGTAKRVLMIGAHPDDENTSVLAALALGQGADVAYLSLTRGEGGQNGIGPELQEGLGLIRSDELLAARRIDGARQYFARAYDFGFSKTAEEALTFWQRDSVLADVVAVIRRFRPDVILSIWSGTPADGHGHHQAAGILAREAFTAAADPARFTGQLRAGLRPHRAAWLLQSSWRASTNAAAWVQTGEFDPLFGRSYHQIAMESRSRHRSQDQGSAETPGPQRVGLVPMAGEFPQAATSMFAGLDTTLAGHARRAAAAPALISAVEAFEREILQATTSFNPLRPETLTSTLGRALRQLERADSLARMAGHAELRFLIHAEQALAEEAVRRAAGVSFDVVASDARVVPGDTFTLTLRVWNGGRSAIGLGRLEPALPPAWRADAIDSMPRGVEPDRMAARRFRVHVPAGEQPTEPYFLRAERSGAMYTWPADTSLRGQPFQPAEAAALAEITIGASRITVRREAGYIDVDRTLGELRLPVLVVPAVSVMVDPVISVVPLSNAVQNGDAPLAKDIAVTMRSEAAGALIGNVSVAAPAGWQVDPVRRPVRFARAGEQVTLGFRLTPPPGLRAGRFEAKAVFESNVGPAYDRGYAVIDYPHTPPRLLFRDAVVSLSAFEVAIEPGLRIGYVEGAGDAGAEALNELGYAVELLDESSVLGGDLSGYDVIVLGVRAYESRPELGAANQRIVDWVEAGGTLIVQYNRHEYVGGNFAPYGLEMAQSADRVTDESAAVRLLDGTHPLLSRPNRIGAADFEGWVQERGLYFMREWDARYMPLLEMNDPGQPPQRGSLLVAKHGQGTYVYVALSLFRQLPEGVPGAYRLLANLVAAGAN